MNAGQPAAPGAGGDDYGDKAFAKLAQKTGMKQNRALNEKITDKLRQMFEKFSGKKVPAKFSN